MLQRASRKIPQDSLLFDGFCLFWSFCAFTSGLPSACQKVGKLPIYVFDWTGQKRVTCCFEGLFVIVQTCSKRRKMEPLQIRRIFNMAVDFASFGSMELVRPWQEPISGMQIVLQELGKDVQLCSDTPLLAAWLCKRTKNTSHLHSYHSCTVKRCVLIYEFMT